MRDTKTGSQIAGSRTQDPETRIIAWLAGEAGPAEGGYTKFSVKMKEDAANWVEIINSATVYFPSIPEAIRTNGKVKQNDYCCG